MQLDSKILGLPASILFLVASYSQTIDADDGNAAVRWPFSLLSKLEWPGSANRDVDPANSVGRMPPGVFKMTEDEGEKFYMEYWQFGGSTPRAPMLDIASTPSLRRRDEKEEALLLANLSIPISYRPAFALHTEHDFQSPDLRVREREALTLLQTRQFSCPTGTSSCSAIGYPNSCCATDETCFQIPDTGLGSVGCCPSGASCGGTITTCDAPNTACPDNNGGDFTGGGCCIPDYVCAGVGCVLNATSASTSVVTSTSTGPASTSLTVITVVTPVTATTVLTTSASEVVSSTTEAPSTTSSYTGLQTTLACSTNSHACPVGMGGGCCGDGYACASSSSCIALSSQSTPSTSVVDTTTFSTATGVVPVRPTGSTTSTSTSVSTASTCPTGFYACEAYYAGGCCRTGRNCDTTSCPATSSTTIISSGVTIVVPVGAAATTANPTGNCASGWSTCPASVGGNCCPIGYACGTASCSLVEATSTAVSPKEAAGGGQIKAGRMMVAVIATVTGMLIMI